MATADRRQSSRPLFSSIEAHNPPVAENRNPPRTKDGRVCFISSSPIPAPATNPAPQTDRCADARSVPAVAMGDDPSWCGLCRCPPAVLWASMSGGDVSFTKRAAQELSRCFNGLTVRAHKGPQGNPAAPSAGHLHPAFETQHLLQCRAARAARGTGKFRDFMDRVPHARSLTELWLEPAFLVRLFKQMNPKDRAVLAQVSRWFNYFFLPVKIKDLAPMVVHLTTFVSLIAHCLVTISCNSIRYTALCKLHKLHH